MNIWLSAIFLILTCEMYSQESENGRFLVSNYRSIEVGFAYPLLTNHSRYVSLIETDVNYGFRAGLNWGRMYNSGYSVSLSPSIFYVTVPNTVHMMEYGRPKVTAIEYHNVSLAFPALLERRFFFKGRVGVGLSIIMPVLSTGKNNGYDIDLSFFPIKNDDFPHTDRPYPRLSFLLKSTFPIFQTETRQNFISFEYLHYLHYNRQTSSDEKLFSLTFIHREMKIKEKRHRWDRAVIKKGQ